MYADDNRGDLSNDTWYPSDGSPYRPGYRDIADDNVNFLYAYGKYVPNANVFVCPSTKNTVDTSSPANWILNLYTGQKEVRDLQHVATDKNTPNGTSYEVLGEVRSNKVTQPFLNNYALHYNPNYPPDQFKPGPSGFWFFHDSDEGPRADGSNGNNELNASDNHGVYGGNVGYCDGHANWVPRSDWRRQWNITRDAGLQDPMPGPY
jgi:prepilin-type processing-associated H-X9-DG protein